MSPRRARRSDRERPSSRYGRTLSPRRAARLSTGQRRASDADLDSDTYLNSDGVRTRSRTTGTPRRDRSRPTTPRAAAHAAVAHHSASKVDALLHTAHDDNDADVPASQAPLGRASTTDNICTLFSFLFVKY